MLFGNKYTRLSDNVIAVISKSLTETVPPVSPVLNLVLGCQHGAVSHSEVTEPLPLSDLRGIVPATHPGKHSGKVGLII